MIDRLGEEHRLHSQLQNILQASEQAAELTHQLLAYAGEAKFSTRPLDLVKLVDDMAPLLRTSASGSARIEVEHGADAPWVHADATQLRQVAMNFITNASEAMEGRPGSIRVRTYVAELDRAYLENCYAGDSVSAGEFSILAVSDDGDGMDAETLERIFEPFCTTKFEGRGLGLAATLGIVLGHGGKIRVETEPRRGTTFSMLLPRAPARDVRPAPARSTNERGSGTILVVDDQELVLTTASRMLAARGFDAVGISSGSRAVDLLKANTGAISAVLLDLTMPGMNGEQTFEALRELEPDLPVVFMSGHGQEEVMRRILGKHRTTNLQKPFRLEDLHRAICSVLD